MQPATSRWFGEQGLHELRCDLLDAAIAEEVLKALQPAEIELALAALAELESRDRALSRQWHDTAT